VLPVEQWNSVGTFLHQLCRIFICPETETVGGGDQLARPLKDVLIHTAHVRAHTAIAYYIVVPTG
jgi:hypothetical protein